MSASSHPSRKEAKQAGWFSRRHETDEAHLAEQARYLTKRADKLARARNGHKAVYSDVT